MSYTVRSSPSPHLRAVDADMQKLRHAGVTITEIGDITPWRRATQSVIDRYGERYSEHLDRIDALRQSNQP